MDAGRERGEPAGNGEGRLEGTSSIDGQNATGNRAGLPRKLIQSKVRELPVRQRSAEHLDCVPSKQQGVDEAVAPILDGTGSAD